MFGRVEVMKRSLLEKAVRGQLASFHDRFDSPFFDRNSNHGCSNSYYADNQLRSPFIKFQPLSSEVPVRASTNS
jgi:hypothetical protein